MSENHTAVGDNSKEDVGREEERSGPRPELEDIEEGYQTPTSEEHKIPAVVLSCPPPAPKKRKRLSSRAKKVQRLDQLFQTVIMDEDVRLILESIEMQIRVPPSSSGPGSDPSPSPKKRRIDK
ncbi:hypothetical protein Salat_0458600 [Sesamum alatum]|uniref:Uncharacterized protein n=1 Tax=Sesamum alatum TaxID=300844 RepID=A0AAE1Z3E7_9LAMI|nr:hypothetical protein Salat_0458600 [Sesamum alatum]